MAMIGRISGVGSLKKGLTVVYIKEERLAILACLTSIPGLEMRPSPSQLTGHVVKRQRMPRTGVRTESDSIFCKKYKWRVC